MRIFRRHGNSIQLRAVVFLAAAGVLGATPQSVSAPEIVAVHFTTSTDGEGQIIRLKATDRVQSEDIEVHHDELNQAFILIHRQSLGSNVSRGRAVDPVKSYRLSQTGSSVRIDLEFDGYRPVRVIAYPDRDSHDALISVHYASVRSRPGAPTASTVPIFDRGSNGEEERWSLDCVVIDAGHGGHDLGAVANGHQEKDINLQVSKLLGKYVEEEMKLRVVYTRTTDRFVPLEERGRIANEQCGKLFISIHVNSAPSRTAEGTEIFFLGLHKTEAARNVMERENSVIRLESNPDQYAEFDDQYILQTLAQSAYMRESETLASFVDAEFGAKAKRFGRGVKQAGFLVLWKASMPAILVELGFITNRKEAAFLNSPDGQDQLARSIYHAIESYQDFYEKGLAPVAAD